MAIVSGHAIAARLRQAGETRTGSRRVLGEGVRVSVVLLAGSALVALLLQLSTLVAGARLANPLDLPSTAPAPSPFATWAFVLFQSSLLPHPLPGSTWWMWGAGCLPLTVVILVAAFRAGERVALRRIDFALLALPSFIPALLVAGAETLTGGSVRMLALALAVPVPIAVAAAAGGQWRSLRDSRAAAPILRALAGAAFFLPIAVALAAVPVLLAPAGTEPGGLWAWMLLPYAGNAIVRGALDGYGIANSVGLAAVLVAAIAVAVHLSRRSFVERAAYAIAVTVVLVGVATVSTPVATFDAAWHVAERTLSPALMVGILASFIGPSLPARRLGHSIAGIAALRAIGDLLPPPAASEITDLGSIEATAPAARSRRTRLRAPAITPHHVGRLAVGVSAGVAVLVAATVAITVLSTEPPAGELPEVSTAGAYLSAAGAGDASRIWSLVDVDQSSLPTAAQPRLLGREDLARMSRLDANRLGAPAGVQLDETSRQPGAASIRARYSDAAGGHDVTLHLVLRGGAWKVVLAPAGLALPSTAVARVTIDGAPVVVADSTPVAVLPGTHQVAVDYPTPFAAARATVTADRPYAQPATAPVGARLDDAAMNAARTAVAAALRTCVAATTARPTGCPQAIDAPAGAAVRWSLVGDPAQSLVVLPDDRGGVVAHGQFQAIGAYDVHIPEDVKHVASGGSFRAPLNWSGGQWSVAGSVDPDTADVARPQVLESQVLAAVRAGFEHCVTTPLLRPADCPQTQASTYFVKDVAWKLTGDPVAGAVVAVDAHHGVLAVTGSYAMTVSYVEGSDAKQATSSGGYRADLFWDGQRLVLVAINRA